MEKFYYLGMNILVFLLGILLITANIKIFKKQLKPVFYTTSLVGFLFLVWDVYFTYNGIWNYNLNLTLGVDIMGVPIEKVLYLFTIPFTGLALFEIIKNYVSEADAKNAGRLLFGGLFGISLLMIIPSYGHWFTASVMALTLVSSIFILYSDPPWIGHFTLAFILLLIPVYFIKQVLTGSGMDSEIINYSSDVIMGKRLGRMPFEELFLTFVLFLWSCFFFEWFGRK